MKSNTMEINSFIQLSKDEQVSILLQIESQDEKNQLLNKIKKLKPVVHMKLLSAIKSKENIDSSIQKQNAFNLQSNNLLNKNILLEHIEVNPFQPRKEFEDENLKQLAMSIAKEGLLQDIVVAPHPKKDGFYVLIAGERRWRAFKINKELYPTKKVFHHIPSKIFQNTEDIDFKKKAMIENINREDMNMIEIADALAVLKKSGMKLIEINNVTGKSISYISRMIIISSLDQSTKNQAVKLKIKSSHMLEMIAQKVNNQDISFQLELLNNIESGMKIAQVKQKIEKWLKNDKVSVGIKKEFVDDLTMTKIQNRKMQTVYKKLSLEKKLIADTLLEQIKNLQNELIMLEDKN